MIKKLFLAVSAAMLVAGCGSNVKLNDVPVEDRSAGAVRPGGGATSPGGAPAAQSGVAPVDLSKSAQDSAGPTGTTNIVYFDYDSFVIKPEFQAVIETHARYLAANKTRKAMLEGHTDERGGREYNLALGQKRSEAVRRAFGLLGVTDAQVEAVSFGKEKPAATGNDEASFAKNRRAEIVYR
jgi:peptidoglycan-associated lipoprotein